MKGEALAGTIYHLPFIFAEMYQATWYLLTAAEEPVLKSYLREFFKESLSSQRRWGDYQCLVFSLRRTNFSYLSREHSQIQHSHNLYWLDSGDI